MPHDKLTSPINYLEPKDLDLDSNKINEKEDIGQGFCLVYASWCGHCKNIMPEYQKFAAANEKTNKNINCYAILSDSKQWTNTPEINKIMNIAKAGGYPCFILIDKQGSLKTGRVDMYGLNITDRTAEGLQKIKKELTGDNKVFRP